MYIGNHIHDTPIICKHCARDFAYQTSHWLVPYNWDGRAGGGGEEVEWEYIHVLINSHPAWEELGSRLGRPRKSNRWRHGCTRPQQPQQPLWIGLLSSTPAGHLGTVRETQTAHHLRWNLRWNGTPFVTAVTPSQDTILTSWTRAMSFSLILGISRGGVHISSHFV